MEMTLEQKRAVATAKAKQKASGGDYGSSYFAQGASGVNEGIANMAGFPVDMINSAVGLGMRGVNAIAGTDFKPSEKPFLGSGFLKEAMGQAIRPETDDPLKRGVRRVGEEVGAALLPSMGPVAASARPLATAGGLMASALGSGTGAAVANQIAPDNPWAEIAGQLIGGELPQLASGLIRRNVARKIAPSVEDLKSSASQRYDVAEASGAMATQQQTQTLATDMKAIATQEGLISPTGRVTGAYPKVTEVLRTFDDFTAGDMDVSQMRAVRRALQDAAGSVDGAERRIGKIMLDKFDNFTATLAPELAEARGLYRSAMKGDMIDTAIELAKSKADQYSASGFDNALRREFEALERQIIKGQLRGLSEAEIDAIKKVAHGGPVQKILRGLGKLAPTGPVGYGTGVVAPTAVATMIGGPAAGLAVGGGLTAAGIGGRVGSAALRSNNANIASALMRRGSNVAGPVLSQDQRNIIAALLSAQSANQAAP